MKRIDFIIKNLQSASFLKDIKNEHPTGELGWGEDVVLKNVLDYNDIEHQLTYLKYFYGDINKEVDKKKNAFNQNAQKALKDFFKKNNPINKKNIDKYFVRRHIFNLSSLNLSFTSNSNYERDELVDNFETLNLLKDYMLHGIVFEKAKDFSLSFLGSISFKGSGHYVYYIACFYSKIDNKHHLMLMFLEEDGNDEYHYIKSFKTLPNLDQVKSAVDKSKSKLLYYRYNSNSIKDFSIYKPKGKSTLPNWSIKENKKVLKSERIENKIFKDEVSFYSHYKNDTVVETNYLHKYPEKYFKKQNPIWLIQEHFRENPNQKFKKFNFYKYIMSDKFNFKNDPKFIIEIIHSKEDLEGLLSFVPLKTQQDKDLAEEIRILKMLRTKDKKFLIKIFNTNKDKLYDLATSYMPKYIFNDPILVAEMTKIDTNIISLIGDKLKKNKKFMKKIWE